jgi:hypothetical protein
LNLDILGLINYRRVKLIKISLATLRVILMLDNEGVNTIFMGYEEIGS